MKKNQFDYFYFEIKIWFYRCHVHCLMMGSGKYVQESATFMFLNIVLGRLTLSSSIYWARLDFCSEEDGRVFNIPG